MSKQTALTNSALDQLLGIRSECAPDVLATASCLAVKHLRKLVNKQVRRDIHQCFILPIIRHLKTGDPIGNLHDLHQGFLARNEASVDANGLSLLAIHVEVCSTQLMEQKRARAKALSRLVSSLNRLVAQEEFDHWQREVVVLAADARETCRSLSLSVLNAYLEPGRQNDRSSERDLASETSNKGGVETKKPDGMLEPTNKLRNTQQARLNLANEIVAAGTDVDRIAIAKVNLAIHHSGLKLEEIGRAMDPPASQESLSQSLSMTKPSNPSIRRLNSIAKAIGFFDYEALIRSNP